MRGVVQIIRCKDHLSIGEHNADVGKQHVIAVCDDGTLWHGMMSYDYKDEFTTTEKDLIVQWTQLNTPPDGDHLPKDTRGRWDKIEEQIREEDDSNITD